MTKLDFHRFQVRHFSNNLEQSPCYCKMGQRQIADLSVFGPGGPRKKNYRPQAKKWVGGLRGLLHKKSFCVNFSHYISGAL